MLGAVRKYLFQPDIGAQPTIRVYPGDGGAGIKVLAISQDRVTQEQLRSIAVVQGWDFSLFRDRKGVAKLSEPSSVPIVVYDDQSPGNSWREFFQDFLRTNRGSCMILCSHCDDDRLWQEVIRFGGYDVVCKPLRETQIVRTVEFAWAYWKTTQMPAGRII